jgi:hypothetical protein
MNHFWFFCMAVFFVVTVSAAAQSEDGAWDIDSLFDDPLSDTSAKEPKTSGDDFGGQTVLDLIKRRGFILDASYEFWAGVMPGWDHAPWMSHVDKVFTFAPGARMKASLGLDVQISEVFRVKNVVKIDIPKFSFGLGDFFFDYNLCNTVFVRGGKYNLSWGISPNFNFTNLLARIPPGSVGGESFILRADVPIGIGGIQVLGLTRADLINGVLPDYERDIGVGGKYNLALRWVDIDLGFFYQRGMNMRSFLSMKTTLGKTELYSEWMASFSVEQPEDASGAASIGFVRDFFDGRLSVNGELFFNAEKDVWWYSPETNIREAHPSSFVEGLNGALNLLYRFDGKGVPRLFTQFYYAPMEESAQIVPGFRLAPWPHIEFYFALPMALGSMNGYYYTHTFITDNQNRPRPFSLILLLSLTGSLRHGYYF